ncbi:bestrophin-like domain [Ancylobacter lacus]|uniref:bestrophin-like domain n=1 Tax=Ancylobacter lacus TaxID=2579970 RepID=UPI001BCACD72|nr:DUF4239 domain-containing protein [Ancylobacter lacus]MBS7537654.1 DUF4239 domain-containing protein [Ancylobacter lacus]
MVSLVIAAAVFVSLLVGAFVGILARSRLPQHHLSRDSLDVVAIAMGMVAAITSVVLGLLIASVKESFDQVQGDVRTFAVQSILLDEALQPFGPSADTARAALVREMEVVLRDQFGQMERLDDTRSALTGAMIALGGALNALQPSNVTQEQSIANARSAYNQLIQLRWTVVEQRNGSISPILLIVIVSWIAIVFFSFGLAAPPNGTLIATYVLCAWCIAACIFVLVEMDRPLDGLIRIDPSPLSDALVRVRG